MAVRIIVLAKRSTVLLADWDIPSRTPVASPKWREVTLDLVRRSRAQGENGGEVYACLVGEEELDHGLLERLADQAARHAWGARLFLVLDPQDHFAERVEDLQAATDEWFDTAQRCGIRLLEARCRNPQALRGLLRNAQDRSRHREEVCRSFSPDLSWRVFLASIQSPTDQVQKLVRPYLLHGAPKNSNLLVVVKEKDVLQSAALREALEDHLQDVPPERLLISTVGVESKGSLTFYCRDRKLPLIHFPGALELRSFLQRITAPPRPAPGLSGDDGPEDTLSAYESAMEDLRNTMQRGRFDDSRRSEAEILETRLRENLRRARIYGDSETTRSDRFQIIASFNDLARSLGIATLTSLIEREETAFESPSPTLLLTHAFNPESEAERCIESAAFVGSVLAEVAGLAPEVDVRIDLAITQPGLRDMMKTMARPTAWVFLGPAGGAEGLWDIASGCCALPDQWVECFPGEGRRPALAVLLGGRSEETAQHFAASRVACAIGHGGETTLESLAFPIREVFRQSLVNGVDCRRIESVLAGVSELKIFCAGHP